MAFIAASQMVQIFLNWSSSALARFGIEEFVQTGKITRFFWARSLIYISNLTLILLAAGLWLGHVSNWLKIPLGSSWLIVIHLVTSSLWMHVQYALQGVKLHRLQGGLLTAERMLVFASLLCLVVFGSLTWERALWCYILSPLVVTGVAVLYLTPFIEIRNLFDLNHLRIILRFSIPLVPVAIVGYLTTSQLDAVFITRYLSTSDLGIYAVAAQINGMVLQLTILANTLLLSMFVSLRADGMAEMVSKYLDQVLPFVSFLWSGICVLIAATSAMLLPLVFGDVFRPSIDPLFILLLSSGISAPMMFGYQSFSNAISTTHFSTAASVLAAIVNISLNFLLIPKYGLMGCAIATFFSVATMTFTVILLCGTRVTVQWKALLVAMFPTLVSIISVLVFKSLWISVAVFFAVAIIPAISMQRAALQAIDSLSRLLLQTR